MTLRGFTGSPAGGGLGVPHLEPRPWLPVLPWELIPFSPYHMAHVVIGWPLLLPGAMGGTFTYQGPRREKRRDTLTVIFSAEPSLEAVAAEVMSVTELTLAARICAERAEAYQGGTGSAELDGEVGIGAFSTRLAQDLGGMLGELKVSVVDQLRLNESWRSFTDLDDPEFLDDAGIFTDEDELLQVEEDRLIKDQYQRVR